MTYDMSIQLRLSDFESVVAQLNAEDSDDRRWAVYELERFNAPLVVDHLVAAIQDEHRAVREAASEVLGSIPAEECVSKLAPLLGSVRIEVRNTVASTLAGFGDSAVDGLVPALVHANEDVRKFAADILGTVGSAKAVPSLCRAVKDRADNVVVSAVEALGKIGSKEALPSLYEIYDEKESLRTEAAEAIGLIGDPSSARFLQERLCDDDLLIIFSLVDALGNVGTAETLPLLKKLMNEAPDVLKEQVCLAILRIGQRHGVNVLNADGPNFCRTVMSFLQQDGSELTDLACYQLTLRPDPEVMCTFFDHADHLPPSLLVSLIHSVGSEKAGVEGLCSLASHEDDWVAYSALEALQTFGEKEVGPTLLNILKEGRGLPVIAAIKSAAALALEDAKPVLKTLAESEDEDIRSAAVEVLKAF